MSSRQPITWSDTRADLPENSFAERLRNLRIAREFEEARDARISSPILPTQDHSMVSEERPHPRPRPNSDIADEVDAAIFEDRWDAAKARADAAQARRTEIFNQAQKGARPMSDDFKSNRDRSFQPSSSEVVGHNNVNRPEETLREGSLKAAIWRNENENGAYHSVTLARTYKDRDGNLQDTSNFRARDMLGLAELARRAHHEVGDRERALFKEQRREQSQSRTRGQNYGR